MEQTITLTSKQKEILHWMSLGLNQKEIAAKVFLSHHTIDDYVARMRDELDCPNSVSLVALAIRKKLI